MKALVASSGGSESTKQIWYSNNEPVLKHLKNTAFYYLNQKNIVVIEVLIGFNNGVVVSPNWVRLTRNHIDSAAQSSNKKLLCRLSPYINSKICFNKNRILDLNLFNQCFFINVSVSPSIKTQIPKRTIIPTELLVSLDNNNLLGIDSNFVRTNIIFGELAKRHSTIKVAAMQATTAAATTTAATTAVTGGGMGSGEGGAY